LLPRVLEDERGHEVPVFIAQRTSSSCGRLARVRATWPRRSAARRFSRGIPSSTGKPTRSLENSLAWVTTNAKADMPKKTGRGAVLTATKLIAVDQCSLKFTGVD
jgi:hypothetical protein